MQAEFLGENKDDIGLKITDNNGAIHQIEMHKEDGEIYAHHCSEYADKSEARSRTEHEHNLQARRYARWYAYRERGYETVQSGENPDRILAVLVAFGRCSTAEFADYTSEFEAQLRSDHSDEPVTLPFGDTDQNGLVVYRQEIYVRPDPTEFDPPVLDRFLADVSLNNGVVDPLAEFDSDDTVALNFDVDSVSGLQYLYNDGNGNEQIKQTGESRSDKADARLELLGIDVDQLPSFRQYVVSHLVCQIRDCFLRMGLEPPVIFQTRGLGKYRAFVAQQFCSLYDDYWSPDTTIESWKPE